MIDITLCYECPHKVAGPYGRQFCDIKGIDIHYLAVCPKGFKNLEELKAYIEERKDKQKKRLRGEL